MSCGVCRVCVCYIRWCRCVSTFVILSPADYQSILAELQSPATLRSDPHFLVPELPVTPNPALAQHHQHHYAEPDSPLPATSQPQPPPWSPVVETGSGEPDSPPKSPPRPCELVLSLPTFELPDPVPSKVRKPHIALNDQLLLSEEEDRSCQEMELSHRPRSHSFPTMCELDIDMAYSTSSPSLSSVSSITPLTPDRVQVGGGAVQVEASNGVPVDLKVTGEMRKVVGMVAADGAEGTGLVGKLVEQDLIKNVERKCEMVIKDNFKSADDNNILKEQKGASAEEEEDVMKLTSLTEKQHNRHEVEEVIIEAAVVRHVEGSTEEGVYLGDRVEDEEGGLQCKDEGGCSNERDFTSEGDQAAAHLLPQDWVEALGERQPSETGSNEEEEEGEKEVPEEALGSPLEEVKTGGGSEEKEEDDEMTEARVQESLHQVEQAEKDLCSLSGWHSDSSSVNVEPPTPGRSVSSDLLDRRERSVNFTEVFSRI